MLLEMEAREKRPTTLSSNLSLLLDFQILLLTTDDTVFGAFKKNLLCQVQSKYAVLFLVLIQRN